MVDRAQSLRTSYRAGSFVQISTEHDKISGEIIDITDDFIILKIAASNQPIFIDVNEARIILPLSRQTDKQSRPTPTPSAPSLSSSPQKGARPARPRQSPRSNPPASTPDQLFAEAQACLQRNDHSNAIKIARQLLSLDPQYTGAAALLERSLEIARRKNNRDHSASDLPPQPAQPNGPAGRDTSPPIRSKYFALALQAGSDEEAIEHLYRCIEHREPKTTSAIKDLANRLTALGREKEAIQVLQRYRSLIGDQQSVDNLLIHIYIKLKWYEEAVELLEKKNTALPSSKKSLETLKKIGDCYIKLGKYQNAIPYLNDIVALISDTKEGFSDTRPTFKRLALCYMQEGDYSKSEQIVHELILNTPDDDQLRELLRAIQEAKQTGQLDENITNKLFSDTSNEFGNFARFMLKQCEFRGIPPTRLQEKIQEKKFDPSDIDRLQIRINGAIGAKNYNDCAEFYLSAASIVFLQDWADKNDIYKYLFLSFASHGDASLKKQSLDTVRDWYCEALHNYDKVPHKDGDEKEAVQYITRFLYSILGEDAVSLSHSNHAIEYVLKDVFERYPKTTGELLNALSYLTSRSKRARQLILTGIIAQPKVRTVVMRYLADTFGLSVNLQDLSAARLAELWSLLDKKSRGEREQVYEDLRRIERFEIKHSLEEEFEYTVKHFHDLKSQLFLQLDRERITTICSILELALRFFNESRFEQREYFCEHIGTYCRELLANIITEPTRLSVERLYYPVEAIQKKVKDALDELYTTSEPHITLELAQKHWVPDVDKHILLQFNIANGPYCSPAEAVEISIPEPVSSLFTVKDTRFPLEQGPSLSGGAEGKFFVPIDLNDEAIAQEAFSLRVLIHYSTRSGPPPPPYEKLFSINLKKDDFEKIDPNPYIIGKPVTDPKMFFGRDEFITRIARMLQNEQGKGIVIYGQKRTGKSSISYHLKKKIEQLAQEQKMPLLAVDVGSMADIEPEQQTSLLNRILWKVLYALKKTLLMSNAESRELLQRIHFPEQSATFLHHPYPLGYFQEILDSFHLTAQATPGWEQPRIILLLDEFQYLYKLIKNGQLDASFMTYWKALLEKNLFNAVLVGLNGMRSFREAYPNEFDAMHDEPISYLNETDAIDLITRPIPLKDGGNRYLPPAIKRILDLTAASPYYIQIFCYDLVEYINDKQNKIVTEATVEEVVHNLLSGKKARFITKDDFDNLLRSGDPSEDEDYWRDALQIMACIAHKSRAGFCHKDAIDCQIDKDRVNSILEHYVGTGVLQRDGSQYRLYVGLFQEWLIRHR